MSILKLGTRLTKIFQNGKKTESTLQKNLRKNMLFIFLS